MSGVLKSVGKVFKKVVKSKVFKIAAIAAAVYFTAGVGMAAAGSTFAAGLPGIASAAELVGVTGGALGGGAGALAAGGTDLLAMTGGNEIIGAGLEGAASAGSTAASTAASGASNTASFLKNVSSGSQLAQGLIGGAQPSANAAPTAPTTTSASLQQPVDTKGWFGGMSEGAQKVLLSSLGSGASAVLGAIAGNSNAKAISEERQKERDWVDSNRQTVDMAATYRPKYKTPGIIDAAKNGG